MAEEGKGVALAILGIVAVIAVVGLVLLLSSAKTGNVVRAASNGVTSQKIYGGALDNEELPYTINRPVKGVYFTPDPNYVSITAIKRGVDKIPSRLTACGEYLYEADYNEAVSAIEQGGDCTWNSGLNRYCCVDSDGLING